MLDDLLAGAEDPWSHLEDRARSARVDALAWVVRRLELDDRHALAREASARLALLDPVVCFDAAWGQALEDERWADAVALCEAVLARQPRHSRARTGLARLHLSSGRPQEALRVLGPGQGVDPDLMVVRAEVLAATDQPQEALSLASQARDLCERAMKHSYGEQWQQYRQTQVRAGRLADDLTAELRGAEAVVLEAARDGRLSGRAGVNFRLLGQAAMATSPRLARHLQLRSPQEDEAAARVHLRTHSADLLARCHLALSRYRLGDLKAAERGFASVLEEDHGFWPALLGKGALLDCKDKGWLRAVRALPAGELPAAWLPVFPDHHALTPEERQVLLASCQPVAPLMEAVARRGWTVRILPLDVRPTDLEALAHAEGERNAQDHRALAGIGGLASSSGIAVARIESLLDTSDQGWTLAHELAHLAFWVLEPALQRQVEEALEAAREQPWVAEQYQLRNVDEFFAVSVSRWLGGERDGPLSGFIGRLVEGSAG